ncbi:putative trehalase [Scheffersomyces xylosifermentans]|uniref:putative trehalase n=1 Tax=Scheffersomyces xylosifermentans TaxID=1304137 RepID=UPI00315D20C5
MSEDIEEFKALTSTLSAFYNYHNWETEQLIKPRRIKYGSLSQEEKELVPFYPKHTEHMLMCIGMNQQFTQSLATNIAQDWGVSPNPSDWEPATNNEYDKVRSTLLQVSKEWSDDGKKERAISYDKIVNELVEMYPDESTRQNIKILNPGCGLGRLVMELIVKGFWCQGNEFSYHMLLTSNFVLNHCKFAHSYSIFPYLSKSSHVVKRLNQIRPVSMPDLNPTLIHELSAKNPHIPYEDLMSMTAGSFTDLYGPDNLEVSDTYTQDAVANEFRSTNKENFDVLVTSFFIDTASNVIDYLKTIHYCLKTGGVWINFGPLLWHFEDDYSTKFITRDGHKVQTIMKGLELTREDLIELIEKVGFKFEKHESDIESTYCGDIKALGSFVYKCEYWVCRKV